MTPSLFLLDETRAWLLRAAEDLAAAAALTAPATLSSALFHCQQAAEKSLKAFLTWHQRPFPRTHNLTVLSGFCSELDISLDSALAPSLALTRFAVAMRYPGETEEPSIAEVREWRAVARAIFTLFVPACPVKHTLILMGNTNSDEQVSSIVRNYNSFVARGTYEVRMSARERRFPGQHGRLI